MKIGLIGIAGSGKDTTALIIQELINTHSLYLTPTKETMFSIQRYAGLLKKATRFIFGDSFDERHVKEVAVKVDLLRVSTAIQMLIHELKLTSQQEQIFRNLVRRHLAKTYISPREFQQLLGTEVGRAVKDTIWVDYIKNKPENIIIPDVRFYNELVDFNILVIRDPVPEGTLHASEIMAAELQMSENPHEHVDAVIYNNGSLEELREKVTALLVSKRLI